MLDPTPGSIQRRPCATSEKDPFQMLRGGDAAPKPGHRREGSFISSEIHRFPLSNVEGGLNGLIPPDHSSSLDIPQAGEWKLRVGGGTLNGQFAKDLKAAGQV